MNSSSGSRRVDKALSRAGDIPAGLWICLSHRNLILAEDKRCSCPSSWGHSKILLKRPIPERLYAVFNEVGGNSVTEYRSGTNWCNKCSILADREFASHPKSLSHLPNKILCHPSHSVDFFFPPRFWMVT